ncbi:hypothetical protein Tco_1359996 [Tanacetum coccineum]
MSSTLKLTANNAGIHIMKETLDNVMRNRYKNSAKYAYHIEEATSYTKNHIVWESMEDNLTPQMPEKEAQVFFSPQIYPNDPARFLYNKDSFYVKNGNTEAKKYVFIILIHATLFSEDDLEERLTRWTGKVFVRFNDEARLSIQHWKEPWAKMFYKKKHRKERSNPVKSTQIKRLLNKNEKRVMNIEELPKFCDVALKNVLEKVLKINSEEYLKHQKQMRRWESYVNGRPILPLRDRPE